MRDRAVRRRVRIPRKICPWRRYTFLAGVRVPDKSGMGKRGQAAIRRAGKAVLRECAVRQLPLPRRRHWRRGTISGRKNKKGIARLPRRLALRNRIILQKGNIKRRAASIGKRTTSAHAVVFLRQSVLPRQKAYSAPLQIYGTGAFFVQQHIRRHAVTGDGKGSRR